MPKKDKDLEMAVRLLKFLEFPTEDWGIEGNMCYICKGIEKSGGHKGHCELKEFLEKIKKGGYK